MTLRLCTLRKHMRLTAFMFLRLTALRLAPDWIAKLKPGGMHLMLMKPSATLEAGNKGMVDFKLAGGNQLLGAFEARRPALRAVSKKIVIAPAMPDRQAFFRSAPDGRLDDSYCHRPSAEDTAVGSEPYRDSPSSRWGQM